MTELSKREIEIMGLSNVQEIEYYGLKKNIYTADYLYHPTNTPIAKYVFLDCSRNEFLNTVYDNNNFYEDVIHKIFFQCYSTDLCWNIYQICVMSDEEYKELKKENILSYEANTNYTRKLVIPYSRVNSSIPISKINRKYYLKKNNILSPKLEWKNKLKNAGLEFCGEEYDEKKLDKYLQVGKANFKSEEILNRYKKSTVEYIVV